MGTLSARPPGFWKHFIGMILIGILNNVPYWVAISSAQAICTHFEKNGYIGAVTWGCVLFGFFATGGNAYLTSKNVSYVKRAIANGICMFVGLIGTAFSPNIFLAIFCISLVGVSSDFGEGVMLGYFAATDDNSLLKAWGIGTGISGLVGAVYSFLCQLFRIPYFYSFISISWFGILYPIAFYYMIDPNPKPVTEKDLDDLEAPLNQIPDTEKGVAPDPELVSKYKESIENSKETLHPNNIVVVADKQGNPLVLPGDEKGTELEEIPATQVKENSLEKSESSDEMEDDIEKVDSVSFCSGRLWCRALPFVFNNTLAFVFQYCVLEGLCDCSMTQEQRENQPYLFCLMSICYQVGQLISKSTARYFMTSKLWIFTILNGVVFTYMMINTPLRFTPFWLIDIMMFFLGSFGGLSYMNIFDVIMKLDNSTKKEREIMTNYTSITISGAIQIASGIILIFQNTFYRQYCKHN
ncbi:CLN3 protein [Tritrichomonas foetus]|uniref:CLN3 protein n=1 Tax=Tritrichomonas foetus TaxID=1144522 RepID=A0A1J4L0Z9_9EUKA|nr:CLN3 protein [Tritrichomonas foetus]|eukprot:OHT15636.1 CLN3 protein [Tritrichomonas foetus]